MSQWGLQKWCWTHTSFLTYLTTYSFLEPKLPSVQLFLLLQEKQHTCPLQAWPWSVTPLLSSKLAKRIGLKDSGFCRVYLPSQLEKLTMHSLLLLIWLQVWLLESPSGLEEVLGARNNFQLPRPPLGFLVNNFFTSDRLGLLPTLIIFSPDEDDYT